MKTKKEPYNAWAEKEFRGHLTSPNIIDKEPVCWRGAITQGEKKAGTTISEFTSIGPSIPHPDSDHLLQSGCLGGAMWFIYYSCKCQQMSIGSGSDLEKNQ